MLCKKGRPTLNTFYSFIHICILHSFSLLLGLGLDLYQVVFSSNLLLLERQRLKCKAKPKGRICSLNGQPARSAYIVHDVPARVGRSESVLPQTTFLQQSLDLASRWMIEKQMQGSKYEYQFIIPNPHEYCYILR